jgi:flagellar biosynthesis component FlhA
MIFLLKVLAWVKKYWKWLLFPIGVLLFFLGKLTARRPPDVVAPELVEADKKAEEASREAERKRIEAALERDMVVSELKKEHAEIVSKLTNEQQEKVKEFEKNPAALNRFLLDVGKSARD